jgi:Flagellar hook-length control protein FliK
VSIVAVVQSQLLQTLFKALNLSQLQDGQELNARVLNTTSDGKATLDINGSQITANFQNTGGLASTLIPGTRVTLKYDNSGKEPKLTLLDRPSQAPISATGDRSQFNTNGDENSEFAKLSAALDSHIATRTSTPVQLIKFVEPAIAARAEAILTAPTPRIVLLQNLIGAITNQGALGNILADIQALLAPPTPEAEASAAKAGLIPLQQRPLPSSLFNAIGALVGQQLNGEAPVLAADIRQALKQSGLFFEAKLAQGQIPVPNSDMKAALLELKDITQKMQFLALLEETTDAPLPKKTNSNQLQHSINEQTPPPPRRDAMPESQRTHESKLNAHLTTLEAVKIIEQHTDQALDRIKLMQFASLPPSPINPSAIDPNTVKNQVWAFELPVRLPNETTVAGFKIEQDHNASNEYKTKIWRVNFAIDTKELGGVHGKIAIQGKNLSITLFAERVETSEAFRSHISDLREALTDSDFEIADLSVLTGKPSQPKAKPGYFVDSAA